MVEDEMVGWHHQLNGNEFEQILGNSGGQRSLACCSPRGHRVRHDIATKQQLLPLWAYTFIPQLIKLDKVSFHSNPKERQ